MSCCAASSDADTAAIVPVLPTSCPSTGTCSSGSASTTREVEPELLHLGDTVQVGPGQRFPSDGIIVSGATSVDESLVTGEPVPVAKGQGDAVIGGTTNGDGLLRVSVTALPGSGTVSRIVSLIQQAQSERPRFQRTADVISAYFTPFIVAAGVVTFCAWIGAAYTGAATPTDGLSPVAFAAQYALSLIVVSCPCAIGLAVPTVIMVATSVAARHGLLLKSGVALEAMARATHVVFDKTGTLTQGKPAVTKVVPIATKARLAGICTFLGIKPPAPAASNTRGARSNGSSFPSLQPPDLLLAIAGAVAEGSTHPLSAAIALRCSQAGLPKASEHLQRTAVNGRGISASILGEEDVTLYMGSPAYVAQAAGIADAQAQVAKHTNASDPQGGMGMGVASLVCLAVDGALLGVLALVDEVRPEAASVIAYLHQRGLRTAILSGDRSEAVVCVARALGIPDCDALGGLSPADKAAAVRRLQGGGACRVVMVGDGINDAVALTAADVGIAMGAGTAVAMDCADVVVRHSNLGALATLHALSLNARRRILWNFAWAAVYNAIAMPLAAGVFYAASPKVAIPPAFAGISELLSSVPVVLGSLLVYRFRPTGSMALAVAQTGGAAVNKGRVDAADAV